ncbi:MAG: 2Fe-2S iron-sulfur cluster binding domain-containing protein [Candidatus Thermoplasmatota archaeon]|jgi:ferredoxin|nr:2Fe-2S iron-sulfur cluster binding domain-containing protein [Candidatus Thermoplasmatota archaeon]
MGGPLKRERAVDFDKSTTVRFFRGSLPIGTSQSDTIDAITEHAIEAEVTIPTNCTSGTCGTCLVRLISGEVEIPESLPPGIDDFLVSQGGILACCMPPIGDIEIDIIPPL